MRPLSEWCLDYNVSTFFPPAKKMGDGLAGETKNPFVAPALWQKRRKDENLPRYHSSSPPKRGHTQRDSIISPPCNGSARPRLLKFSGVARAASSAVPSTLCLAPPGTSLRARRCLLLCVIAFDVLNDNRRRPESQVKEFGSGPAHFCEIRTLPGARLGPGP